jgi:hypothetical protein
LITNKLYSIVIENIDMEAGTFDVWANENQKNSFMAIDGIVGAYTSLYPSKYSIIVDPRYDLGNIILTVLEKIK